MDTSSGDEQLMLRYQQGEHRAFEILYSRHKGALYRYFLRHCGITAVAEELFPRIDAERCIHWPTGGRGLTNGKFAISYPNTFVSGVDGKCGVHWPTCRGFRANA